MYTGIYEKNVCMYENLSGEKTTLYESINSKETPGLS